MLLALDVLVPDVAELAYVAAAALGVVACRVAVGLEALLGAAAGEDELFKVAHFFWFKSEDLSFGLSAALLEPELTESIVDRGYLLGLRIYKR